MQLVLTASLTALHGEHPLRKVNPDVNFHLHYESLLFSGLYNLGWGNRYLGSTDTFSIRHQDTAPKSAVMRFPQQHNGNQEVTLPVKDGSVTY